MARVLMTLVLLTASFGALGCQTHSYERLTLQFVDEKSNQPLSGLVVERAVVRPYIFTYIYMRVPEYPPQSTDVNGRVAFTNVVQMRFSVESQKLAGRTYEGVGLNPCDPNPMVVGTFVNQDTPMKIVNGAAVIRLRRLPGT